MANVPDVANDVANERCAQCGALLAMVGRSHRCIATTARGVGTPAGKAGGEACRAPTTELGAGKIRDAASGTYRYRNVEQRRAYMRDLMRRRRALLVR